MQQDQLDPLERALEHRLLTTDICGKCFGIIQPQYLKENPGTQVCNYCAVISVNVDLHEEER